MVQSHLIICQSAKIKVLLYIRNLSMPYIVSEMEKKIYDTKCIFYLFIIFLVWFYHLKIVNVHVKCLSG
jgi:hypothetical protein